MPAVDETLTIEPLLASRGGSAARIVAHEAHHVQLPHLLPLLVGDLGEARVDREADVVDEDVEPAELADGGVDDACGRVRLGEVGANVELLPDSRRLAPPARRDARALGREQLGRLEADPAGRAGDETRLPLEAEIHRTASVAG